MTLEEAKALLPVEWSGRHNSIDFYAGVYKTCTIFLPVSGIYFNIQADVQGGYGTAVTSRSSALPAVLSLPMWKVARFGVIL